jgi:hypothetical protein
LVKAMPTMLRLLQLGLLASFAACLSPTLPLPPPEAPTVEASTDADYRKLVAGCGGAEPNAIIVIINANTAVANDLAVSGSRADDCGAWDALVYAHTGDTLNITQEFGNTESTPTAVQVP